MLENKLDGRQPIPSGPKLFAGASLARPVPEPTPTPAAPQRGPQVDLVEGDLLRQDVDAIVNAWNRNLIPHWLLVTQGVSGAIKRAAGSAPFQELRKFGVLPLGAARLTSAGKLPFKGIIHVAGINHAWLSSERSVRESVRHALAIARNEHFSSVAFPAIGAGSSVFVRGREVAIWGLTVKRSLAIIQDEAARSDFEGRVVVVKFRKKV